MTRFEPVVADLRGRHVVVTGASTGIGFEAAKALSALGARVTCVVRDADRGRRALEGIVATAGGPAPAMVLADFARLGDVADAAVEIGASGPVDVLVNNAGLISTRRVVTDDGFELTWQVNHLAHFLLTNLLLDHLKASDSARVITVSSDAHLRAWRGVRLGDPGFERGYDSFAAYAHSKLANIMFAYELARRLEASGVQHVTSNAMHPGPARTGFSREWTGLFASVWKVGEPFMTDAREAADTAIYLAASAEVEGLSGQYFFRRAPRRSSRRSYDRQAARLLWESSERMVGLS